jgi:CheY-like chemotaxis protein
MTNNNINSEPIEILLVEDNPGDAELTVEAFKEAKVNNNIYIVEDGKEAIAFLNKEGKYNLSVTPDIILLDLNLPKMGGLEVLSIIKEDDNLKHIPVVVLTTSSSDQDILKSYKLHANCYITKPVKLDNFIEAIQKLDSFWLSFVKLPVGIKI